MRAQRQPLDCEHATGAQASLGYRARITFMLASVATTDSRELFDVEPVAVVAEHAVFQQRTLDFTHDEASTDAGAHGCRVAADSVTLAAINAEPSHRAASTHLHTSRWCQIPREGLGKTRHFTAYVGFCSDPLTVSDKLPRDGS